VNGEGMVRGLVFVGSSLDDPREFPEDVKDEVGYALWLAQNGQKHKDAKPLSGIGGAGVLEVVETSQGDAYRAVYTVRFPEAVYVLHVFKKKSTRGIATPKHHINLITQRLKEVEARRTRGEAYDS
jgi:phage-related protein